MKIILKEYLASLRERGDLDKAVLPNLLSAIGLRVLNTPMIGTRQNGVDIAAVGKIDGEDEQAYLYLFCIKAGNISRSDWVTGIQAVRPELDEIREVYLRSNVAREHAELPVKICLCCGGELEETVLMNWAGYTESYSTDKVSFEEWNGDRLAALMMRSLLARELLDDEPRRNFQKAVAMVNEPDACYEYVRAFLGNLLLNEDATPKQQILRLRQSFICLHAVIAWAIDANNLESIYKTSELGMLLCWDLVRKNALIKKPTKHDQSLMLILDQFLKLYFTAAELYFEKTAYAHSGDLHALSAAVRSRESVDINLAMFELLGRLAVHGIWTALLQRSLSRDDEGSLKLLEENIQHTLDTIVSLINSNPSLNSPICDDHMIEIALVMYFAQFTQSESRFFPWLRALCQRTSFALLANTKYPTCMRDYADLLVHPISADQSYRDEACAGSILYPYLYLWLHNLGDENEIKEFIERLEQKIPNCTYQAWLPDEDSDEHMWRGDTYHGVCVPGLSPSNGFEAFTETLNEAMTVCNSIGEFSAIKLGLVPMLLTACRHYRLPIPPNFWLIHT